MLDNHQHCAEYCRQVQYTKVLSLYLSGKLPVIRLPPSTIPRRGTDSDRLGGRASPHRQLPADRTGRCAAFTTRRVRDPKLPPLPSRWNGCDVSSSWCACEQHLWARVRSYWRIEAVSCASLTGSGTCPLPHWFLRACCGVDMSDLWPWPTIAF